MDKIIKHVQMDRELSNAIKKAAAKEYCSDSALIRKAVSMYIKGNE